MKRLAFGLMAALLLTAPTMAASYIPLGPKVYTPVPPTIIENDPVVIQNDPIVTTTGGGYTGSGSQEPHARLQGNTYGQIEGKSHFWNEKCQTIAEVNADCTVLTMVPTTGAMPIPVVTTVTPVDPTIIPVDPTIINHPPTCKQRGIGSQGIGWYSC